MSEHRVEVGRKPYTVTVEQKSTGVWMAVGDYGGKSISVVDRSSRAALRSWIKAAEFKGG